jgi:hypothetical protein
VTPEQWADRIQLHFLPPPLQIATDHGPQYREVVAAIRAAVAEEREACAQVAERHFDPADGHLGICDPGNCKECDRDRARSIAAAIRARTPAPALLAGEDLEIGDAVGIGDDGRLKKVQ